MSSPRSIEVKVGVLILAALGLLIVFVLIMGGINFQPTYKLFVDFDNPGGLLAGAPVKVAGVKVGKVLELNFQGAEPDLKTGKRDPLVRLKVEVEKRYQKNIHEDAVFYVTTQGVLGEQFLAIEPGSPTRPPIQAGAVVRAVDPPRLDMLIAETYELLHQTVATVRERKDDINDIFDGLRKTLKGTGEMFGRDGEKIANIMTNLEHASGGADELVRSVRAKYVDNPQITRILGNVDTVAVAAARDAPGMMADARHAASNVRNLAGLVGDPEQQARLRQLLGDLSDTATRAKSLAADASQILLHLRKGKGTVGALVMDEQLFDDLQEMARDLKHNPWKFFWKE